jgi:hypothetical protein
MIKIQEIENAVSQLPEPFVNPFLHPHDVIQI